MGWIKSGAKDSKPEIPQIEDASKETSSLQSTSPRLFKYQFAPTDNSDSTLPFISTEEVTSNSVTSGSAESKKELWIVVDDVIYNCSAFVHDHPGGEQVIRSFQGADCSWQFWRFHGKQTMHDFGRELRIGRTSGVKNPFVEPTRWVGLRTFGSDEWE